ncbi:CHC2 zinc finger domain-containing protein [Lysobacter sp. P5_B9]
MPSNWRDRLPLPECYYRATIKGLGTSKTNGQGVGICPFHADNEPMLQVDMVGQRGTWHCPVCDARGDMIAFVMKRGNVPFPVAIRDLMAFARQSTARTTAAERLAQVAALRQQLGSDFCGPEGS